MQRRTVRLQLAAACASVMASGAVANTMVDPFCPAEMVYLVGLKCGASAPITLNCVPEMMRNEICQLPETAWARMQCEEQVGRPVAPELIEEITGLHLFSRAACRRVSEQVLKEAGMGFNMTPLLSCQSTIANVYTVCPAI